MRVLIGCEESGVVREAFRKLGHDAWSNDLIPARDGGPHLQMDVRHAMVDHGPWAMGYYYFAPGLHCNGAEWQSLVRQRNARS